MKTDKTKKPGILRYVSLGDVHLGHRQTPTELVLKNLDLTLTDGVLKAIDLLIITGDLFDRQLQNGDDAVHAINRWITRLMRRCAIYNVMIEIVEGTPSHDRGQSRYFVEQMLNAEIPVKLHYSKILDIRYIEQFDIHVLYVPDKHNPDPEVTLAEIRVLMRQKGIKQVDFAIMHGAFSYQLPSIVPEPTHSESAYLDLVKYHILIGHVHNMTVYERIYAAGSFDRICHNDEIPKGMFDISVRENGTTNAIFVHNKGARRYDTLDVHDLDTKGLNDFVRNHLQALPKGSAIRLRCNPHDVATGSLEAFQREFPQFTWDLTTEKSDKKKLTINEVVKTLDTTMFRAITPESITSLVELELRKITQDESIIARCIARLPEYQ